MAPPPRDEAELKENPASTDRATRRFSRP